jgi:uncharacterized membrane protein
MQFDEVIETLGRLVDAVGVAAIVIGAAAAGASALIHVGRGEPNQYRRFRQGLGQAILLGLELLVAGDIVRTVAANPTLNSIIVLAGIVLIRTFLSWTLEVEISGRWPWQKPAAAAGQD